MTPSILIRLSEIERDYAIPRYQLERAVKDGRLVPYAGPLAKKWAQYFRTDIEALAAQLKTGETK
jgi:hypothetical protein